MIGAVAMKKLMLTKAGKGWIGVTIHDRALLDLARRTVGALRWRGPCEVEVLRGLDGRFSILEVNPRFPAWCDLCAGAGANLPRAVVDWAHRGSAAPVGEGRPGVAFVRVSIDQIVPIAALEELAITGESTAGQRLPHLVPLAGALL
jgi:carbamoyl-phosphate synthase large subunit